MNDRDRLALAFADIARAASETILAFGAGARSRLKPDRSPVTDADEAAEALILARLAALLPGLPVIAEERAARGEGPAGAATMLLVDPLDGTREFLAGTGEYTVNIALVEQGAPVAGAVHAPALGLTFIGGPGGAARLDPGGWSPILCRPPPRGGLVALTSRSHPDARADAFLAALPVAETIPLGSSLKFCRIAEGAADIYVRYGPTHEWDVAAGHAVLAAAGGRVTQPDGRPFAYGKPGFRNEAFVAWGAGA